MATLAQSAAPAPRTFFRRMALGLTIFILLAFAQFSLRGMANPFALPLVVHLHALTMVAWLVLFTVQAALPTRGALALHKRLGWTSVILVPLIVAFGIATVVVRLEADAIPPFFTPSYFLLLSIIQPLAFAGLVAWAVAWRSRTDWHRRLMVGAVVMIMEPAIGRILPMPLMGGWAHWAEMAVLFIPLALMAAFDPRQIGRIHPATIASALVLVVVHLMLEFVPAIPAWEAYANGFVGG